MTALRLKAGTSGLALLGAVLLMAAPGLASIDKNTLSAEALAEIESLERSGLYTRSSEGSLGPDLWKGAERSEITSSLKDMPPVSPERGTQAFIHGVLLTKNDGGIENDKPPAAGEDLFTLRLEKLLSAGLYEEAAALYGQLPGEPYHEDLAYVGALALMFNGDKSSGCIEARAAAQSFAQTGRFNRLIEYCGAEDKKSPGIYEPTLYKDYSLELLATVAANDTPLDASHVNKGNIKDISPLHISLLLKSPSLSDESRFLLTLRAVHFGLMSVENQQAYYTKIATQEMLEADWKKIAETYVMTLQLDEKQRWPAIREVLLSENTYGTEALLPFAEMLTEIKPLGINYAEITAVSRIMIRGGYKIPSQWAETIRESVNQDSMRPYDSALLGAAYLSESPSLRTFENKKRIFDILKHQKNKDNLVVNYIIENIDKSSVKDNNNHRVYEKDYTLTFAQHYVMPTDNVWHRLQNVSQESNIGETVLLSTLALGDKRLTDIHPEALVTVLKDLEKVGLTDTSEKLALAALIGRTFKGEN
ncbi:MAG: hypothetical protein ACT4OY_01660 [Alphaproteobacteria bacterium]